MGDKIDKLSKRKPEVIDQKSGSKCSIMWFNNESLFIFSKSCLVIPVRISVVKNLSFVLWMSFL